MGHFEFGTLATVSDLCKAMLLLGGGFVTVVCCVFELKGELFDVLSEKFEGPKTASKSTFVLLLVLLLLTPQVSFIGLLFTALNGSLVFENASLEPPNGSFVLFEEKLDWLKDHEESSAEEFDAQKKEIEEVANPIVAKLYGNAPPTEEEPTPDHGDEL